jgi:hypothetical protein
MLAWLGVGCGTVGGRQRGRECSEQQHDAARLPHVQQWAEYWCAASLREVSALVVWEINAVIK